MSAMMHSLQGESITPKNSGLPRWVARFPWLRRQLHPWIIHFPITFMLSATFFSLLYLLTRVKSFQDTAWHCLGGGVLFMPLAIGTGLLTEKQNFPDPPKSARTEKILSMILMVTGLTAFIWGLLQPDILDNLRGWNLIYLLLIILLTPLVTVIGYFGGMITFPLE
jgi:uncharacterized membrane protein